MDLAVLFKWLGGFLPPVAFLAILLTLWDFKFSPRTTRWILAGFLAAESVLQWMIYTLGDSPEFAFTLLPLTFYLPVIIVFHLLSSYSFLPTAALWLFALLCQELLLTAQRLLGLSRHILDAFAGGWISNGLLLLATAGLVAVLYCFFREPFRRSVGELEGNWVPLLSLPLMLLALYSYLLADVNSTFVLFLLFFTALAAVLVTASLLFSLSAQQQAKAYRLQMEALRQEYELLEKKLELGRSYRHDTRHHMTALSALLQQGDAEAALEYVSRWQGQMSQIEGRSWCHSPTVNAVLSAYASQAEAVGCSLDMEVALPGELFFEETDLCVVLANAMENAIHACEAMPEGQSRHIRLKLELADCRRLTLRVENSCHSPVEFDENGFPITEHREGHGQGLKSIAAVVKKYQGMFHCGYEKGQFDLRVVLLSAGAPSHAAPRRVSAACAGVFLGIFLLNCMPALAQTLETIPLLGQIIRVVDLHSYSWHWGGTGISVEEPVLDGDPPAVDQVEEQKEAFIQKMRETFLHYAARKYQGYVDQDVTYEIVRDDEALFLLRFDATVNAGGSADYHRYILLDKRTEQVLTLKDLFQSDVNYLFPISREIKAQMEEQMKAGTGDYFLPGGIWEESECFQSIDEDQNFYVDEDGRLVIVFDEYEVAPGSMGAPEFTIPTDALEGLLAQPSVLK